MTARKPTAMKVVAGTFRKDRARNEPQYTAGHIAMPATLSAGARTYWRELSDLLLGSRVLTAGDRRSLELTCEALELHRAATKVLVEQGATYETTNAAGGVMLRLRPEATLAADAWRRAMKGLTEFGLTPASRPKAFAAPSAEPNPFSEFFP